MNDMGRKPGGKNAVKPDIENEESFTLGTGESHEKGNSQSDSFKDSLRLGNDKPNVERKSSESAQAKKDLREALDAITSPEILGDVAAAYSDSRLAATGDQIFLVNKETRIRIGTHARTCIKAFNLIEDPKYYALGMLIFELGRMVIVPELIYRKNHPTKIKTEIKKED